MTRIEKELPDITDPEIQTLDLPVAKKPKRKLKFISKIILYLLVIFVILIISGGYGVLSSGENLSKTLGNISLLGQLKKLISSQDKMLLGEEEDRINILLLGMGGFENGKAHDGPYLTDTIIIASYQPSTNKVALISIPRDLSVPIPGHGYRKINSVNSFGETANPGQGAKYAAEIIGKIFELPIHYYVRIDFAGFKKIIDDLGGITVDVENNLEDFKYPVPGKETATTSERYEHLLIEKGITQMDGELALKYVRSRQALGVEGSDFARSKRQQKVLLAVKEKGLSFGTLVNPYKISKVMDTFSQHLSTNLEVWEIIRLFNLGKNVNEADIIRKNFDDSPDGGLKNYITEEGAFVLITRAGNFSQLQAMTRDIFGQAVETAADSKTQEPEPTKEEPKKTEPEPVKEVKPAVEIQNGTKINGLAGKTSQYLESLNYEIVKIGNAPTQDYQKTVIYPLSESAQSQAEALAKILKAEVSKSLPGWVKETTTPKVSGQTTILVVLGQDQK